MSWALINHYCVNQMDWFQLPSHDSTQPNPNFQQMPFHCKTGVKQEQRVRRKEQEGEKKTQELVVTKIPPNPILMKFWSKKENAFPKSSSKNPKRADWGKCQKFIPCSQSGKVPVEV